MSKYALIIVDMIKDNVNTSRHGTMDVVAGTLIAPILELSRAMRKYSGHVVFACDSFMEGDFIFEGRMRAHAIRGSGGDLPIDELEMKPQDLYLPKRRMSAFHKTDLDQTLRTWGVDTVVVCGITTNVCVLLTVMDALQNDFRSVLVSDASASHKPEIHEMIIRTYEKTALLPLLRIMTVQEVVSELQSAGKLGSDA